MACGKKIKNPCKLCLQPVTQKTGLQCQGACLSWVHYSCLNYTPGRIKDIKAGIIKVSCPCPDCKTKFPKEYRTDEPYSCNNQQCPANRPPKCGNITCPSNAVSEKIPQGYMPPLSECGAACSKHGVPSRPESPGLSCGYDSATSGNVAGHGGDIGGFPTLQAVEQMCNTVGQLTTQINDLMLRMRQTMQEQGGKADGGGAGGGGCCPKKGCPEKGPKANCPKTCYCPGNPARK